MFDTIHEKILKPTCATGRGTCHTSDAAKGGLVLEQPSPSYTALTNGRVVAGDVSCSLLMKRLGSTDPKVRMPPGSHSLTDGEICTISQWIAKGALR